VGGTLGVRAVLVRVEAKNRCPEVAGPGKGRALVSTILSNRKG